MSFYPIKNSRIFIKKVPYLCRSKKDTAIKMENNKITHSGIVQKIEDGKASVSIISKASCISCSLNSVCSASDLKEKIIDVALVPDRELHAGDEVTLELKQSYGNWAVALGYFFPFLVLLGGLILFLQIGMGQGLAGLLAIALLVPYYGILYSLRGYFQKKFRSGIVW